MDLRGMIKVGLPWSMVVSSIVVSSSFFSLAFCFSPNCSSRIAICSAVGLDTFSYTYMYMYMYVGSVHYTSHHCL